MAESIVDRFKEVDIPHEERQRALRAGLKNLQGAGDKWSYRLCKTQKGHFRIGERSLSCAPIHAGTGAAGN
jgi:hypothetical protein